MGSPWNRLRYGVRHRPGLAVITAALFIGALGFAALAGGRYFSERAQLRSARAAVERHAWLDARKVLQAFLEQHPNHAAAHLLAARAARRLELLYEAGKHLDACERLQGGPTRGVEVERALIRVHRGDVAGVEEFLRARVAGDDPDAVEILDILSGALILSYRIGDAQQCLDELLRRQPDHFHALVRRGWVAQNQAWYPQAIEYLDQALALRPEVDSVRLSLAELQVVTGRFEEAQRHFEQLRQRQPENASVLFGLARSLAGRGEKDQALQLLDQVLAHKPNDWKALGERGWLAAQLDRPAEGESYLRRAEALAPPDLPLLTRLADCLRMLGKGDEARAFQEKASRLKADFQRAQQLGDEIRERQPHDAALRHELAAILLRLGKVEDALHWFGTALAEDPKHRPTHEALLAYYDRAGNAERAAYHRQILGELPASSGAAPP